MRASGILLPIFSLPGKYGIGCFSKEAYDFVDFLAAAKQKYWQILPVGPTSYGDSPYQSFSTFAGNPYFIDLEKLIEQGLLTREECDKTNFGTRDDDIDYGQMYIARFKVLRQAFAAAKDKLDENFRKFIKENDFWIQDYALFMAIKDANGGKSFYQWEEGLRRHDDKALEKFASKHEQEITFYQWLQYEFYTQWYALKAYANEKKVQIIGDIPIYVAEDSADVWAHPELFQMDEEGNPKAVAGCPPDGFSATGQLWGNPLYLWEYHKKNGFAWWIQRIKKCNELYDMIRIDHFRGFDQYYSIPAGSENAVHGEWEDGPGLELFTAIKNALGELNIIAEDLGYITDSVRQLVKDTGFPNMKVLEFAFDARDQKDSEETNDYLPFNYDKNCVVYTGTHDNETLRGWLGNITPAEFRQVQNYCDEKSKDFGVLTDKLVRQAQASTANICIIPLQDYLKLDNHARINMPSTTGKNWKWRLQAKQLDDMVLRKIRNLTRIYGRG